MSIVYKHLWRSVRLQDALLVEIKKCRISAHLKKMLRMTKVQVAKRCIRNDGIKCALGQPVNIPWVHPSRSLASKWSNMPTLHCVLHAFLQFCLVPLASTLRRLKESLCGSGGISWDLCGLSFSLFAELRPSTWQKSPMECSRAHLEELWGKRCGKNCFQKLDSVC